MGETVVCPEFPLLVSRAMIRICRAEFSRAMVVPILAVAFCGVALGCQSIDLSEPTDGGEGNKYEAPTAAPAVPFQQLKLAGSTRGGGCMRVRPALPPRLKQGRSTGSFRRMQLHPRRGSVEPFALCGPTPKRCWQLAAGTSQAHSQVLYRAGRRFGCPSFPSLALFHVPPCLALLLCPSVERRAVRRSAGIDVLSSCIVSLAVLALNMQAGDILFLKNTVPEG